MVTERSRSNRAIRPNLEDGRYRDGGPENFKSFDEAREDRSRYIGFIPNKAAYKAYIMERTGNNKRIGPHRIGQTWHEHDTNNHMSEGVSQGKKGSKAGTVLALGTSALVFGTAATVGGLEATGKLDVIPHWPPAASPTDQNPIIETTNEIPNFTPIPEYTTEPTQYITPQAGVGGGSEPDPDSLTEIAPNTPEGIQIWEMPNIPEAPTGINALDFRGKVDIKFEGQEVSLPVATRLSVDPSMASRGIEKIIPNSEHFSNQEITERVSKFTMQVFYQAWREDDWESRSDVSFNDYLVMAATGVDVGSVVKIENSSGGFDRERMDPRTTILDFRLTDEKKQIELGNGGAYCGITKEENVFVASCYTDEFWDLDSGYDIAILLARGGTAFAMPENIQTGGRDSDSGRPTSWAVNFTKELIDVDNEDRFSVVKSVGSSQ